MRTLVVDMDDVSLDDGPAANHLDWMYYLRGKHPDFKINLFVIPKRCTPEWIDQLHFIPWINVCMHGWHHAEGEVITPSMVKEWDYASIYKGPNWQITQEELDMFKKAGWVVAVKEHLRHTVKQWELADPRVFHGHVWIESDWKKLDAILDADTDYKFIQEVL